MLRLMVTREHVLDVSALLQDEPRRRAVVRWYNDGKGAAGQVRPSPERQGDDSWRLSLDVAHALSSGACSELGRMRQLDSQVHGRPSDSARGQQRCLSRCCRPILYRGRSSVVGRRQRGTLLTPCAALRFMPAICAHGAPYSEAVHAPSRRLWFMVARIRRTTTRRAHDPEGLALASS